MNRFSKDGSVKFKTASKNINELDNKQSDLFESRIAMLRELANTAIKSIEAEPLLDKLRKAYLSATPNKSSSGDFREACESSVLKNFFDCVSVIDKLEICRELTKTSGFFSEYSGLLHYADGSAQQESVDRLSRGRIAYMKNNYTESAFLKFSKIVENSRSAYFQSFDDVCEEVYSGSCEFCILPLESSTEGRLNSFYSMIDRYELKIAAVCVVEQHDSQRSTKFALLKKSLSESSFRTGFKSEQILEFKVSYAIGEADPQTSTEGSPVCDIILAANACGMRLLRIDSIPLPYSDEMTAYYVSLTVERSQLLTFLLYIMFEFPQCELLGVYYTTN